MKKINELLFCFILIVSMILLVSCGPGFYNEQIDTSFTLVSPEQTESMRMLSRANETENLYLIATLESKEGTVLDSFEMECESSQLIPVELTASKGDNVRVTILFCDRTIRTLEWAKGSTNYFTLEKKIKTADIELVYTDVALYFSTNPFSVIAKKSDSTELSNNSALLDTEVTFSIKNGEYLNENVTIVWYFNDNIIESPTESEVDDKSLLFNVRANYGMIISGGVNNRVVAKIYTTDEHPSLLYVTEPFCFTYN